MTNANRNELNDMILRRDSLNHEFNKMQAEFTPTNPRTPEDMAKTRELLAKAKQLDADIDAYMKEHGLKHDPVVRKTWKGKVKTYAKMYKKELIYVGAVWAIGGTYALLTHGKAIDILVCVQPEKHAQKVTAVGVETLKALVECWDKVHPGELLPHTI